MTSGRIFNNIEKSTRWKNVEIDFQSIRGGEPFTKEESAGGILTKPTLTYQPLVKFEHKNIDKLLIRERCAIRTFVY